MAIESEVIIQHYDEAPPDFLVADYAIDYPFAYAPEDRVVLAPYMAFSEPHMAFAETKTLRPLTDWVAKLWQPREQIQTSVFRVAPAAVTGSRRSLSHVS